MKHSILLSLLIIVTLTSGACAKLVKVPAVKPAANPDAPVPLDPPSNQPIGTFKGTVDPINVAYPSGTSVPAGVIRGMVHGGDGVE